MAHEVFICYSKEDKPIADLVCNFLERNNIRCWVAPRDILPGKEWSVGILEGIEASKILVLIFSKNADASPQVLREVERAVNKNKFIIPFRIADITPSKALEYYLSVPHWLDALTEPIERHVEKLVDTILLLLGRNPSHVPETESTQAKATLLTNYQIKPDGKTKEFPYPKPNFFTKHWRKAMVIGVPLIIIPSVIITIRDHFVSKQSTTNLGVTKSPGEKKSKGIIDEGKNKNDIEQNALPDKKTTEELKISKVDDNSDHAEARNEQANINKVEEQSRQSTYTENKQPVLNTNNAGIYVEQGIDFSYKGKYDDAIANFTKALEINPRCVDAYYNRGLAYYSKGIYDYTISDCNKALEIDKNCCHAYAIMGGAYFRKNKYDTLKFFTYYEKAVKINPRCWEAYYFEGIYLLDLSMSSKIFSKTNSNFAISRFSKVLEINPDYAPAYYHRGVSYFYVKKYGDAWNDVHKAQMLGIQPDPKFLANLRSKSGRQN